MTKEQVRERLLNNEALFNLMFVFQQHFDIVPSSDQHIGASIAYQDIRELRTEFLEALVDTIVDWIYDAKKFEQLKETYKQTGKSDGAASNAVIRKAKSKFRRSDDISAAFVCLRYDCASYDIQDVPPNDIKKPLYSNRNTAAKQYNLSSDSLASAPQHYALTESRQRFSGPVGLRSIILCVVLLQ